MAPSTRARTPRLLAERFWEKVAKRGPDECWEWQGFRLKKGGYGKLAAPREGRKKRTLTASHVAWELTNGPVPEGMRVLHKCDNPPCVNPAHLFIGTAADNTGDMVTKSRHCHGVGHPEHVLSDDRVREIRQLKAAGVTYDELVRRSGVSRGVLHRIVHRTAWRHVD